MPRTVVHLLAPATRRQIAQRLADRSAAHPLGRWALVHAVNVTSRGSPPRALRAAALHLRSGFVRRPQLAVATTAYEADMVVDLSDWRHQELLAYGVYEAHVTAMLQRIAWLGWTFVDVGANVGYFAALASRLGGREAIVHAFEPHPRMAAMAEINARMNEGISYVVFKAACGASPERLLLHKANVPGNIGDSTMIPEANHGAQTVEVDVVRLDDHCERHGLRPDVVKIDVEGFEQNVLDGMANLLGERIPAHLIVEVGGGPERPSPAVVVDRLLDFGYDARSVTPEGGLKSYVPRGELQDVCFVRRGSG